MLGQLKKWMASGAARALGLAALVVLLGTTLILARAWPGTVQPVAFNHRLHTQELELDCETCHEFASTGAHSGLPSVETCATCHSEPQGTSPQESVVVRYVAANQPLVFEKLFRLPTHVFYTHRRHVGIAELTCRTCHGDIALTTRPPRRPLVKITMEMCIKCHSSREQTTDCVACHR